MGNSWIEGGQCYDSIQEMYPNDKKVQRIIEIWKKYHLNGMNAGCIHQDEWRRKKVIINDYHLNSKTSARSLTCTRKGARLLLSILNTEKGNSQLFAFLKASALLKCG